MSHFIETCKICGDLIAQCRCMSCEKTKLEGTCKKCLSNARAEKKDHGDEEEVKK